MTSCLSKLKVTPSFCFAFKIPDDVTASSMYVCTLCLTLEYNKDEYEPMYTKVVDPKNNEHTDSPYVLA